MAPRHLDLSFAQSLNILAQQMANWKQNHTHHTLIVGGACIITIWRASSCARRVFASRIALSANLIFNKGFRFAIVDSGCFD
jgi:hypothetical protein